MTDAYWRWPSSFLGTKYACQPCGNEHGWDEFAKDIYGPTLCFPWSNQEERGMALLCQFCGAEVDRA